MSVKSQVGCPKCGQRYSVGDEMAGQTLRCAKCGEKFAFSSKNSSINRSQAGRSTAGGAEAAARSTSGDADKKSASRSPRTSTAEDMPSAIGPFQIRKTLGQGAFGVVYLAYHPFLDIEVALKMLRTEAKSSAQAVERFQREAKILAKMDHPNVLRVYDAGQHGKDYYLASAYIPGRDLAAIIPDEGLEPRRAVRLTVQMLRGLGYAHGLGIVHRDVKPANTRLNDQDGLFLMDFGMAGWAVQEVAPEEGLDQMRLTRAGAIIGTPAYMAPEQASGLTDQAGPQADLFSAGVVFYELLTGKLPFEAANLPALLYAIVNIEPPPPSHLRAGLDPRFDAICLQALAKRPENRFRDAEAFAAALEGWLNDQEGAVSASATQMPRVKGAKAADFAAMTLQPFAAPPPQPIAPAVRSSSRKIWIFAGVFAALMIALLVTILVVFMADNKPTRRGFKKNLDEYQSP
jgi:serine/threonine protein kinase